MVGFGNTARRIFARRLCAAAFALWASAALTAGPMHGDDMARRVEALDPTHVSQMDVRDVLSRVPAPRIILLQGSAAFVSMQPFAQFLIAMGYPEERLRNPADGSLSRSSFGSSAELAGTLAWYYEHEGMMPMLIGHSQGGMLVIKTLHELAGEFSDRIPVWNPIAGQALPREWILDPASGVERPVVGLKVPYAAAIATGKLMRLVLGQWSMLPLLRKIPDTVDDFTGFTVEWDAIAGTFPGSEPYAATGTAHVRNVILPSSYLHVDLPRTQHLAANGLTRAWIEAYAPGTDLATAPAADAADTSNLLHAADVWYSVKKHWCTEAQRVMRARNAD